MKKILKHLLKIFISIFILFIIYFYSTYSSYDIYTDVFGDPIRLSDDISPDGIYRIEYYAWRENFDMRPFFVKIYNIPENRLIVTSDIHDMAELFKTLWPSKHSDRITIGHGMSYKVR